MAVEFSQIPIICDHRNIIPLIPNVHSGLIS